ncbi:MAG: response regulator transcription factor [Chitinophagales bacterium]|nr:response regulator transcription factor [Chitinophagales bacterium]
MNPIRVAIVDDQKILISVIKEKLSFFSDISIIFTAYDGKSAFEKFQEHQHHIDIILMDIEMPILNGIETTKKIRTIDNQVKILMLTVFDNDDSILNAIQAGADGYLLKDISSQDLHSSILQTIHEGTAMTPSIALKTLQLLKKAPITANSDTQVQETILSKREIEILELIAKGHTHPQISELIFISPSTVRKHLENIYSKLQVHSKIEAINEARKQRWID